MAKLFSSLVSLLIPVFILILFCCISEPCQALKIKLIPPTSPESPLYLGNLTLSKKVEKLVNQSKAYSQLLSHNLNKDESKTPRPVVLPQDVGMFAVGVYIGTFDGEPSSKPYLLVLDTSSDLIWVQCEECNDDETNLCFPQVLPFYPNTQSRSYVPLLWSRDHERCYPDEVGDDMCFYHITYGDNSKSYGQLAYETFNFDSANGENLTTVGGLVFGCGFEQVGFPYGQDGQPNLVSGRLGLGQGVHALHQQLSSDGKFSYCLHDVFNGDGGNPITYLRFGDDIPPLDTTFMVTPLLSLEHNGYFYISAIDIMVNDNPLMIPSSVFQIKPNGSGGMIFDSATSFSQLAQPAYDKLQAYLVNMYSSNRNYIRKKHPEFGLCYYMKEHEGYNKLPRIVFVVEGGRLEISPEQAFIVDEHKGYQFFCLAMMPNGSNTTVIGGYQQVDHRFIYDTKLHNLWFKAEDCARDP